MFFLPNSIKFIMDRPVGKDACEGVKRNSFKEESEPERINSEGPTCCKVSSVFNPRFYMIKYTRKPFNAPLSFVSLFFSCLSDCNFKITIPC